MRLHSKTSRRYMTGTFHPLQMTVVTGRHVHASYCCDVYRVKRCVLTDPFNWSHIALLVRNVQGLLTNVASNRLTTSNSVGVIFLWKSGGWFRCSLSFTKPDGLLRILKSFLLRNIYFGRWTYLCACVCSRVCDGARLIRSLDLVTTWGFPLRECSAAETQMTTKDKYWVDLTGFTVKGLPGTNGFFWVFCYFNSNPLPLQWMEYNIQWYYEL